MLVQNGHRRPSNANVPRGMFVRQSQRAGCEAHRDSKRIAGGGIDTSRSSRNNRHDPMPSRRNPNRQARDPGNSDEAQLWLKLLTYDAAANPTGARSSIALKQRPIRIPEDPLFVEKRGPTRVSTIGRMDPRSFLLHQVRMGMSPHVRRIRDALGPELIILPSVSGAVFDEDGRILLVRHREGDVWSIPGGAIEPEEIPADALVRELWEETGLHVRPLRILGIFGGPECTIVYGNGDRSNYVITMFECEVVGGTLTAESDETCGAAFVGADELHRYRLSPWLPGVLPDLFDRERSARFRPPAWAPPRTGFRGW
jgi:8-oxo-dGTP pyrophosphatase MutT (NUDIX family)